MSLKQLEKYVRDIENSLVSIKKFIANFEQKKSLDAEQIRILLADERWPKAVPEYLMCTESENDRIIRAEGILDLIGDIEGKKVLDFGCGEGHVVMKAMDLKAKFCIGYDLVESGAMKWGESLVTNWDSVVQNGPYDVVIIYDVLDHCTDPVQALFKVKTVCHDQTQIYLFCHPFVSRHGSHLYREINKAFVHLVFTAEELKSLDYKSMFTFLTYNPLVTYRQWFLETGFDIAEEEIALDDVSDFETFLKDNPIIRNRMVYNYELQNKNDRYSVCGRWTHTAVGIKQQITLAPNGKIIIDRETINTTSGNKWELVDNNLIMTWIDKHNAPNGAWIDRVSLNNTRDKYFGKNQIGTTIAGERLETDFPMWELSQSFIKFILRI